jgi:hypothetical protein
MYALAEALDGPDPPLLIAAAEDVAAAPPGFPG